MNITVTKDIIYDKEHNLPLDLYAPERGNGYAVVYMHGGGWFQGDKANDADAGRMFAEAGYLTAVPDYRLAPAHLFPAARDDIFTVYGWLAAQHAPKAIGVAGSSSGGNLAIELGMARGIPAVSWSGVIDLDGWIAAHPDVTPAQARNPEALKHAERRAVMREGQSGPEDAFYKWFVLNYTGGDAARLREASPLHRISPAAGPMLLINSMYELCPAGAVVRMQEKLIEAGVPVMTKILPGGRHAKDYLEDARTWTLDFFQEYLIGC